VTITGIHIIISGMVQGVGFRFSTRQKASELGITGRVRNIRGGRVECIAEGDKDAIEKFIGWCRMGPPAASVESVQTINRKEKESRVYNDFTVEYGSHPFEI